MKRGWLLLLTLAFCLRGFAAEVMPPKPERYFNDYAQVVSGATAARLNSDLENLERQSSEQIVVAVFPKMQSDSSVEDYTLRVFRSWGVGQRTNNNGAALFVFVQDHKMFLQTGYGLEGVLPDALCKRIIDEQIAPRFKANDFDGGLTAGVQSIIAATKGEYKGTGFTVADRRGRNQSGSSIFEILFVILVIAFILFGRGSGMFLPWLLLSSSGPRRGWGGGGYSSGGGFFSGGGGGGGGFSGGGGGFSGGGGSGGGGGAGGSW